LTGGYRRRSTFHSKMEVFKQENFNFWMEVYNFDTHSSSVFMGRAFEFRKARKFKRWGQMSKTFTKYGKQISMAVKSAGPHPESNAMLRAIIQNAKVANMPKDNIERAIKKATEKGAAELKEIVYEGKGPHGIAFMIDTATDNPTRTIANLRTYFSRTGGAIGVSGSVEFLFERKSVFKIERDPKIDLDELELELIDHGGEEVGEDETEIVIYGAFESFGSIQKFLEGKGYQVLTSDFERIPNDTKELTEEQMADVEKLIEKLEEDEDVQGIFHNMG
jgi:YebC/PmpR family DNA-binding regulatory protein